MQFYPTDPYDKDGGICNIVLRADSNGDDKCILKRMKYLTII